jgi:hypothetical protein
VEPYLFHSYILVTEDCNVSLNTWTERENISREDVWSKNVVALEMMEWLIFLQSNLDGSERTVAVLYRTGRSTGRPASLKSGSVLNRPVPVLVPSLPLTVYSKGLFATLEVYL